MRAVAVYDTNVLFSGTGGWKGSPYRCLEAVRADSVELIACPEILSELGAKLRDKLEFSPDRVSSVLADLLTIAKIVSISGSLKVVEKDPCDDMIIECAVAGNATHIVTGDHRHLLPMKHYDAIQIVTCAEFLAIIES